MLLSEEVNRLWRNDAPEHFFAPPVGATDDFRYGMSLNPHMKAFVTNGRYDLVTPYYASDRLRNLMRLDPEMASRLTVRHFGGGHMFYAWEQSRREFTAAIAAFVADAGADQAQPHRMAVLTSQAVYFPRWYQDVLSKAELAETGPVRGTMVIRPWGYAIWEHVQAEIDARIKGAGAQNVYFPL